MVPLVKAAARRNAEGMQPRLVIRPAALADVPRLVALNEAAYPDLVLDGVVFDAAQLMAQQAVFPEGQIVVEDFGCYACSFQTALIREDRRRLHAFRAARQAAANVPAHGNGSRRMHL